MESSRRARAKAYGGPFFNFRQCYIGGWKMKGSKKGAIVGALWGLVSFAGFGLQLTKPINQVNIIYDILFLPGSIAARTVLVPTAASLIVFPISSIIIGTLIGYVIGRFLGGDQS